MTALMLFYLFLPQIGHVVAWEVPYPSMHQCKADLPAVRTSVPEAGEICVYKFPTTWRTKWAN